MLRISKNKKGFTLLEMIIVVAIVVILASVLMLNVGPILNPVSRQNSSISQSREDMRGQFQAYENSLSNYNF